MIKVTNDKGRSFNIRVVFEGDKYGLNDCLTYTPKKDWENNNPLVEFYDATYANNGNFGERGQFVSNYYLSTLIEHNPECGIDLHGGVEGWEVSADNVKDAITYARLLNLKRAVINIYPH